MADSIDIATGDALIYTGKGFVYGLVATCSSTTPSRFALYDNTTGSGTKIFEANVSTYAPLVIFFRESFAPIFLTGLFANLSANLTVTIWSRQQ